jgi:hypothetical protein
MQTRRSLAAISIALLLLAGCRSSSSPSVAADAGPAPSSSAASPTPLASDAAVDDAATPAALDTRLRARAGETLAALKSNDMNALAAIAHPTKGVRFTPYPYVDTKADVTMSREQLRDAMGSERVRNWGSFDGRGDPIDLTFRGYFKRFVWTADFTKAPQVGIDKGQGTGNTVDNLASAYPSAHFVELFFPGFDPKFTGMDWQSLRLVFEEAPTDGGQSLWLVGIIHGQWTI